MNRRTPPKILRMKNLCGATYEVIDIFSHTLGCGMNCPTCGEKMKKGKEVSKATFVHSKNGFVTRDKIYCSDECVPKSIQSA